MSAELMLFGLFFRIGAFGFGGGLAILPLIFQSVSEHHLMNPEDFANLVALSQVTPGPIMVNAATFVGVNYAGLPGAVAATLGVSLPSFFIMLAVIRFLDRFRNSSTVENILKGIRPATVGLIGAGAVFMAKSVEASWVTAVIVLITVVMSGKFKINPIIIIVIMAIAGGLLCG